MIASTGSRLRPPARPGDRRRLVLRAGRGLRRGPGTRGRGARPRRRAPPVARAAVRRVRRRAVGRGRGRAAHRAPRRGPRAPAGGAAPAGRRRRARRRARGAGRRGPAAGGAVAAPGARALPRPAPGGRAGGAAPGPRDARRGAGRRPRARAPVPRGRGARPVAGPRRAGAAAPRRPPAGAASRERRSHRPTWSTGPGRRRSCGAWWTTLAAGTSGCVLVEGPAGIGKSRLLVEAVRLATAGGVRVLSARGSQLERSFGFGAVRQLFEPCIGDPARRDALLGRCRRGRGRGVRGGGGRRRRRSTAASPSSTASTG